VYIQGVRTIRINIMSESRSDHFPSASKTASSRPRVDSGSTAGGAQRQKRVRHSLT